MTMITSIGADSDRADAADEPTPPHLAVDDAAAVAVAATATATANSNNNEKEQILDGKEHAVSSSSSSLLYVSSSATIPMPPVALPAAAAAVTVVEAADHHYQQQQQTPYEKAIAHAATLQSSLFTLLSQKSHLESSAITEWSTKISNYESQSLREMNDELQQLQNVQAEERKVLEEKLRLENEMEEQKLTKSLEELKEAMDVRRRESKKRCRGMFTTDNIDGMGGEEEQGGNNNETAAAEEKEGEEIMAKKKSSRSAEKEKELEVRLICRHFNIIISILSLALIQRHSLTLSLSHFVPRVLPHRK